MASSVTITAIIVFFFFSTVFTGFSAQTLISPITKDNSTNLYTLLIYLNTPLQPSKLHLDLGSYFPWYDCPRHYKSSPSYRPIYGNTTLCDAIIPKDVGNCFQPPGPGCANDSCNFLPENPTNRKIASGDLIMDKFALLTDANPGRPRPVSDLVFACTSPHSVSKIYRGLARGSVGLAALGRFNYSISAQLSKSFTSPQIFAVCLPSSSAAPGLVWFNSPGPYYFSSGSTDQSKLLIYTPLQTVARGSDTQIYYNFPSPEYYVEVAAIRINGRTIPLNKTLLKTDEFGLGGVKLSSSRQYSVLQTSIFQALRDAFVKEAGKLNLTRIEPAIPPFEVCYAAEKIESSVAGPGVPTIDLVLQHDKIWRIYGSNSMIRVATNNVDAWCLAIMDGGAEPRTSIIIGAHQLEDNLLQFDLQNGRVGFTSSLLVHGTRCSNFTFNPPKDN